RRQQVAGRLATDDILTAGSVDVVRRIRLAPLELAHGQGSAEPGDPLDEITLERADVETMRREDVDGGGRRHGPHCKLLAPMKVVPPSKRGKQAIRWRGWAPLQARA